MTYPNGDLVSYVTTVFDTHSIRVEPRADGEETIHVAWFALQIFETANEDPAWHPTSSSTGKHP
jgi:hypothetical protein